MSNAATRPTRSRVRNTILIVVVLGAVVAFVAGSVLWLREARIARVRDALPVRLGTVSNSTLDGLLSRAQIEAARGDLEAVAELGRLYHANEFPREAEACWRLLIREQPDEARWHYYLADLMRTAGDQAAVEEQLSLTVVADPSAAIAWLQLAEMNFKSGRVEDAETGYRRRLELLPNDPYADLGLARVAQLQGQEEKSAMHLERVLKHHPKFSAAQNLYAELQASAGREDLADHHRWLGREAGRFREADDPWMDELNARCYEPNRLCHLGAIAYQTDRGDRGHAYLKRAVELAPRNALAHELLGSLLLEQGSAEAARDVLVRGLNQAEDLAPTPLHYLKLHEAYRSLNEPEPARRALADGLRRHPDSSELLLAEGNQLKSEARIAEAAAAFRKAVQLNPAFVEADFALAVLLLETGRNEEAMKALKRALSMQPTFPKAALLLARLEMEAGRFEVAGEYLLPLLKANPGTPEIREITARWRLQAGRAAERTDPVAAERHYRAGLKLQPENPELNAGLGVRLLVTNRVAEAVPLLQVSQQARPNNLQAALFLGQAYARTNRLPEARRVLAAGLKQAEGAGQETTASHFREILSTLP